MPDTLRLSLELEGKGDPPVGRIGDERGTEIAFAGWVGLARALDRLLSAETSTQAKGDARWDAAQQD